MLRSPIFAIILTAATLAGRSVSAQEAVPQSLDAVRQSLKPDQIILVTDDSGRTVRGRIIDLSETTLALLGEPSRENPTGERTVPRDAITRIAQPDEVWNGLLLGLAAGIAANYAFIRYNCGPPGYDRECSVNVAVVAFPIFVPAGLAVGALIDHAVTRTIFKAGRGR